MRPLRGLPTPPQLSRGSRRAGMILATRPSPARNLDRVHQITGGSLAETELYMKLLTIAENNVLAARTAHKARKD
jgi:hypothetical protein